MLKPFSFCAMFLVMTTSLSYADFYRCKSSDGSTIFTDNQSNIPPECQVDVVREPLSDIIPYSPSQPVKQRSATQRPVPTTEPEQREALENVYSSLKEKAERLANQFVSTRRIFSVYTR